MFWQWSPLLKKNEFIYFLPRTLSLSLSLSLPLPLSLSLSLSLSRNLHSGLLWLFPLSLSFSLPPVYLLMSHTHTQPPIQFFLLRMLPKKSYIALVLSTYDRPWLRAREMIWNTQNKVWSNIFLIQASDLFHEKIILVGALHSFAAHKNMYVCMHIHT
jgi:hypothetical protein